MPFFGCQYGKCFMDFHGMLWVNWDKKRFDPFMCEKK